MLINTDDRREISCSHLRLLLLLGIKTAAPVKSSRDFLPTGIQGNLLVEELGSDGVVSKAVVQPGGAPMSTGRVRVTRKALRQFDTVLGRLRIVLAQQVHVPAGIERFREP